MADTLETLTARYLSERDEAAASVLVHRTRPRLLATARRIVAAQDAEDVVHTAFLSLFHKRGPFDAPVMPWLVTAVVRIAYRYRATERRQVEIARRLARPSRTPDVAESAACAEELKRLRANVDRLPAAYRDAVVLHHLEGLRTEEVARLLGVSQDAVKKRLERGRRMLLCSLAPSVSCPFLVAWWCLTDVVEATAGHLGVVAMKLKTGTLVVGVALAAGAAGLGVGAAERTTRAEARAPVPQEHVAAKDLEIEELRSQVAAGQEREAVLRREIQPRKPVAVQEDERTYRYREVKHAGVRDAALRLSVPPEALVAAVKAEDAIARNRDDAWDLIREVQKFGEAGFRAALAIVQGGTGAGEPQRKLLDETYLQGLEGLLLETIDSAQLGSEAKGAAINTLARADTPTVRDYLVDRIENEKDRALFWTLVMTLGKLKEPRAAKAVGRKLLLDDPIEDANWRPTRLGMLHHLSAMGGEDAVRILREFVDDPRAKEAEHLMQALNSLALLNKPLCDEVARGLLEDPRSAAFSPEQLERARNFTSSARR